MLFLLTEIFFISWIEEAIFYRKNGKRELYLLNCIGHQSCQAVGIFVKGSMKDYGHTDPSSASMYYIKCRPKSKKVRWGNATSILIFFLNRKAPKALRSLPWNLNFSIYSLLCVLLLLYICIHVKYSTRKIDDMIFCNYLGIFGLLTRNWKCSQFCQICPPGTP